MTDLQKNIQNIVNEIYESFESYQVFKKFEGSPLESDSLAYMNTRFTDNPKNYDWDNETFVFLSSTLLNTIGDEYHFKRYLPRYIDLAVQDTESTPLHLVDIYNYLHKISSKEVSLTIDQDKIINDLASLWLKKIFGQRPFDGYEDYTLCYSHSFLDQLLAILFCLNQNADFWIKELEISSQEKYFSHWFAGAILARSSGNRDPLPMENPFGGDEFNSIFISVSQHFRMKLKDLFNANLKQEDHEQYKHLFSTAISILDSFS